MNYKKLTALDLVTWFATLTGGYINKGRDSHMIKRLMEERGLGPTQVLYGMVLYRSLPNTKDVPNFCRAWELWHEEDVLYCDAELARLVSGQPWPRCVLDYLDLRSPGIPSARMTEAYRLARQQTEAWTDGILTAPTPAKLRGSWVARLSHAAV